MSQVVHLEEVELVRRPYQIRPPIEPFNPRLIILSTAISDSSMVDFDRTLICYQFP